MQPPQYEIETKPATEPLTEAKTQLRETSSDFDAQITSQIGAARHAAETRTGRSLITQTWKATLSAFPSVDTIQLSRPPVQSITSVTYLDTDDVRQTFAAANYTLDKFGRGFVSLAEDAFWPSGVKEQAGSVEITFICGYGSASSDIPGDLVNAVRLLLEDSYCGPLPSNARDRSIKALLLTYVAR